ncbi:MAG TPA: tetratricopeptide repeat protein [Terriglobia bacterium]|nr:tetratricopeptide repeat protein [Terriglobia bacterium]
MRIRPAIFLLLLALPPASHAQNACRSAAELQKFTDQSEWSHILEATGQCRTESADEDYYRGLAFAALERWTEAQAALAAGETKYPQDKRFPEELAGVAFKRQRFPEAERHLHRALKLDPHDRYAINFLGTIYFLGGNLEAALKYWNRIGKPQINQITTDPQLRIDPALLDRAFTCSPASVLTLEQYRTTLERLGQLGVFSAYRLDLAPAAEGSEKFDLTLSVVETNGWGRSKAGTMISVLRGLPYETVYPEFYNLRHSALNIHSLFRWDSQKRRAFVSVSAPLAGNPKFRYRFYADGRNENWNISRTFIQPVLPVAAFNLEKLELGAGFGSIASGRWTWDLGMSVSDRRFRNLPSGASTRDPVLTNGAAAEVRARSNYALIRIPEKRFRLDSGAQAAVGNFYAKDFGRFATVQGSLAAHWLPQARGDDFEIAEGFYAGKTFGRVPFDDLFMLGLERDNNLPLRAHIGTENGQKGNAPLGRDYLLSNWEVNKDLYTNAWIELRLAPFLDTGRAYDRQDGFGSRQWLWDTGASLKLKVLGGVALVFTYGKDLRTGRNTFYFTTTREGGASFLP